MNRLAIAALAGLAATLPEPLLAHETAAFTAAFAGACVPQRLSFDGTKAQALSEGWVAVETTDHPELKALMENAVAALEAEDEIEMSFVFETFRREVEGRPLHLVVSRSVASVPDMDPFIDIGCYLYDFEATSPPDPAPVTALLDKPIARSQSDDTITAFLWGPACPMPRTGDTYMTYIPAGSPYAETTGFTGLMMKFATAEPDPGEVVPETYCTDTPPAGN